MKNEAKIWLDFAEENLRSAEVLLKNNLFNPCLQSAQQCVEKAMKALLINMDIEVKRTHDIFELHLLLTKKFVKKSLKLQNVCIKMLKVNCQSDAFSF